MNDSKTIVVYLSPDEQAANALVKGLRIRDLSVALEPPFDTLSGSFEFFDRTLPSGESWGTLTLLLLCTSRSGRSWSNYAPYVRDHVLMLKELGKEVWVFRVWIGPDAPRSEPFRWKDASFLLPGAEAVEGGKVGQLSDVLRERNLAPSRKIEQNRHPRWASMPLRVVPALILAGAGLLLIRVNSALQSLQPVRRYSDALLRAGLALLVAAASLCFVSLALRLVRARERH